MNLLFSHIFGTIVGVLQMMKVISDLYGGSIVGGGVDGNGYIDGSTGGRGEVMRIYFLTVFVVANKCDQVCVFCDWFVINYVLVVTDCDLITYCHNN